MTITGPNFATVRVGSTIAAATRTRWICGDCRARVMRCAVSCRRTRMPVSSGVNCGSSPFSPVSSASFAGYEMRLSSARTNRRTEAPSTVGVSSTAAPGRAFSAAATPWAMPTFAPKRAGTIRHLRPVKTSCTGRANAGRKAAWACSFDMPPSGTPATVTPWGTRAGGAASPLSTGARAAMTRTETPSRRITRTDRTYGGGHNQGSSVLQRGNQEADGGATAAALPRLTPTLRDNPAGNKGTEERNGSGEAESDGSGNRRRGEGNPRRRRERQHDQEAVRLDRGRVDGGASARIPRPPLHDRGRRGVHQRRHPLRRDDPAVVGRRNSVPEAARVEGRHPRDQGGDRREAAGARRG